MTALLAADFFRNRLSKRGNHLSQTVRAPKKEIIGWAMFDFANSSYTTVIVTVVFSVIFPKLIVGNETQGNLLWSVALSISNFCVAFTAPVLGAMADFSARRKRFLFGSYILTVIGTAALFFVGPGDIILAMSLVVLSGIGFALGESFVASFLPDLAPPEELGKISGYGWGIGYFGGLISTAIVMFGLGAQTLENFGNMRLVGPITGGFFLVAAIPTFLWLKEHGTAKAMPAGENYFTISLGRLRRTFSEIKDFRDLAMLFLSFLFGYAGLSIVISFAFIYGDQIVKWDASVQVLMFVITQFTAAAGALLFGFIQDRLGAKKTFAVTLVIWVFAVVLIYGTNGITAFLNATFGIQWQAQYFFLLVGSVAGLGLGSTQSTCRAMVGLFAPESKAAEFFGFWGLTNRFATIIGLLSLGFLQTFLGLQLAILVCAVFFVTALFISLFINEERGRKAAVQHEGE